MDVIYFCIKILNALNVKTFTPNDLTYSVNPAQAQQEEKRIFFSEALNLHLPKYEEKSNLPYYYKDYEEGTRLFDSLVE